MKEQGVVLFGWLMGVLVDWSVCFVLLWFLPMFFFIPSLDGWKMERILLQDFCNSPLRKSVFNAFKIVIILESRIYFERCKEFK